MSAIHHAFRIAVAAAAMILPGCTATGRHGAPVLLGSSVAPRNTISVAANDDSEPIALEFMPSMASTCRPDFRLEAVERSNSIADAPRFAFLSMSGATCAPAASGFSLDADLDIVAIHSTRWHVKPPSTSPDVIPSASANP